MKLAHADFVECDDHGGVDGARDVEEGAINAFVCT